MKKNKKNKNKEEGIGMTSQSSILSPHPSHHPFSIYMLLAKGL
jgi:hypothetical protein